MPRKMKVGIVDPDRSVHYETLLEYLERQSLLLSISKYKPYKDSKNYDIVLTSDEWFNKSSVLIAEAKLQGIPTLHIADGITKWGNVWENPRSKDDESGLPMFQPILADKIACIGPSQARLFCSWGQSQKVEVTGLPRFDHYVNKWLTNPINQVQGHNHHGASTLAIIIANQPGYTDLDIEKCKRSLIALNNFLSTNDISSKLKVTWRVGATSPDILPTPLTGIIDKDEYPIISLLANSDFVIASPSTAVLEAMSMDIPTCIIDFLNKPEFLQAAWNIRSEEFMHQELLSLFSMDERRMLFQRYLLHDQMRLDAAASPRIAELMQAMTNIAHLNLAQGRKVEFPDSMVSLASYQGSYCYPYKPQELFPAHPIFSRSDTDVLACEFGHLRMHCKNLETELACMSDHSRREQGVKRLLKRALQKIKSIRTSSFF